MATAPAANLATVVCLLSRDRGGPRLKFQLLIYPLVDYYDKSPSMQQYSEGHFLTRAGMDWFRESYLPSREAGLEPSASPMYAKDVAGLPPAMMITAECDPLRDQGEAYARKLQAAGVPVELKRYEGMIHVFLQFAAISIPPKTCHRRCAAAVEETVDETSADVAILYSAAVLMGADAATYIGHDKVADALAKGGSLACDQGVHGLGRPPHAAGQWKCTKKRPTSST